MRLQSAMEYLMTYGWAILVIAIVLGALYYLSVFGGNVSAPRAQPGSCQVFRPNGPGTSYDVGLSGVCNNELPEFVAEFTGSSSMTIKDSLPTMTELTESIWVESSTTVFTNFIGDAPVDNYRLIIQPTFFEGVLTTPGHYKATIASGTPVSPQPYQWFNIVMTYNSSVASNNWMLYVNGQLQGTTTLSGSVNSISQFQVGGVNTEPFSGNMSNIQLYNTSLSASEVKALYLEGIGGAPVSPAYIIGWWPLNGNSNDYSGNMNNGVPSSITYASSWTSLYSAP